MMYVNWPEVVQVARNVAPNARDQRARDFVIRTLPNTILKRVEAHADGFYTEECPDPKKSFRQLYRVPPASIDHQATWDAVQSGKTMMIIRTTLGAWVHIEGQAREVVDYLNSLDDEALDKLPSMTWAQVAKKSEDWHAKLARQKAKGTAGDEGTSDRLESADGHYWVRLVTTKALEREGSVMGHCVGQGGYDDYTKWDVDEGGIWSLRDRDGRSVLTAEIEANTDSGRRKFVVESYKFEQIKGAKNRELIVSDLPHVKVLRDFYTAYGFPVLPYRYEVREKVGERVRVMEGGTALWVQGVVVHSDVDGQTVEQDREPIGPEVFTVDGDFDPAQQAPCEAGSIVIECKRGEPYGCSMYALSADGEWVRFPFTGKVSFSINEHTIEAEMVEGSANGLTMKSDPVVFRGLDGREFFARSAFLPRLKYIKVEGEHGLSLYDPRNLATPLMEPVKQANKQIPLEWMQKHIENMRDYEAAEVRRRALEMTVTDLLNQPLVRVESRIGSLPEFDPTLAGDQQFITTDIGMEKASLGGSALKVSFEPKQFPSATPVIDGAGKVLGHYQFLDPTPEMKKCAEALGINIKREG